MKPKKCAICRERFTPARPMSPTCDKFDCKVSYAEKVAAKSAEKRAINERKEFRARKAAIRAIPKLKARAVYYCHRFIRLRDGAVCISCGTRTAEGWHAGHYIAGTNSPTKFDPININVQCSRCNTRLHGNLIPYRNNLIEKYGIAEVERLENSKGLVKWSRQQLEEIIDIYKRLYKELNSNQTTEEKQ